MNLVLPSSLPPLNQDQMDTLPLPSSPTRPHLWSPLHRRVPALYPLLFVNAPHQSPLTSCDSDGWFQLSFLHCLLDLLLLPQLPSSSMTHAHQPPLSIANDVDINSCVASSVDLLATSNRTVLTTHVPIAMLQPQDTLISPVPPSPASLGTTILTPTSPPKSINEVAPQVYNGDNITEIPWVDESSEWELLLLLGDWYEPDTFDSVFSSIASDAVHFFL